MKTFDLKYRLQPFLEICLGISHLLVFDRPQFKDICVKVYDLTFDSVKKLDKFITACQKIPDFDKFKDDPQTTYQFALHIRSIMMGQLSTYSSQFVRVKVEEEKDQEYQKVLQSELLSGGIDLKHINVYTDETKKILEQDAELSDNQEMLKALKANHENDEQDILLKVMYKEKDKTIDRLIEYYQKNLLKMRHKFAHATIGGDDGMRITRAAFAVLLKYRDLVTDFELLVETMEDESEIT